MKRGPAVVFPRGNGFLLFADFFATVAEEGRRVSFPEALNRLQAGYEIGRHRLLVNLIQNLLAQRLVHAFRQLPSVKRGRALVSPRQKSGVGQDLEVVAQCALAHRECGAKLRHTERIGPHNPEYLHSQWVCQRTEKCVQ